MSETFSLDHLAAHWRDHPSRAAFAALADALRKRGDLSAAAALALEGLAHRPDDVPGLLALARIRADQNDPAEAERLLREALAADATHPVVRRDLGAAGVLLAVGGEEAPEDSAELLYSDDGAPPPVSEPLLTESLAVLYHRQGHLDRAEEVYTALLARDPDNVGLRSRRDQVAAAAAGRRPRPYDATLSGGRSLRGWLAELAAVTPRAPEVGTAYDAFFHTDRTAPPPDELEDFEAFQSWLKGLDR